ncbi:RNA-binding domain-containing protein [Cristinia sonorae]|uniref:RNA-binding domain-containing protein n=1 Tax=Cristinia sonorae TaxID=1940300 RepID=A0A8K0UY87_9AGAR|nr:RNA-binding domain-containing protein [Cristinia sonorae]
MASTQPNATLYINNLNDKVNKEELRLQLFALFTTYGRVIDVVALKNQKMRGQAFLVFNDLAGATAAMRACEGIVFYDKPMHISYAKTKSYATMRKDDPNFVPPTSVHAKNTIERLGANALAGPEKRQRDDRMDEDGRETKREKTADDDDEGEEMEIEDDEDSGGKSAAKGKNSGSVPPANQQPSSRLLCTNLPQEVTDDVLSVLFQQYQGFQTTHIAPNPTTNAAGQKSKMAQVLFDSPDLATVAKEALDGFTLKKGWVMSVAYI